MNLTALSRLVKMAVRGRRLLSTLLFIIVVALASAAFVAGIGSRADAGRLWDGAFNRANGPHITLSAPNADSLLAAVHDPRMNAVSQTITALDGVNLVRPDGETEMSVRAKPTPTPLTVGEAFVVAGRSASAPEEVTIEKSFARDLGIRVGDRVRLRHETTTADYAVVGLVLDFNDCFYPQCDPGIAWTVSDGIDRLGPSQTYSQIFIRVVDPPLASEVVTDVLRSYGSTLSGSQDWLDTRGDALSVNDFFGTFLSGFGVFVLIAAGIVVAGSVTNRVLARRRDIGLLKAAGVTPALAVASIVVEHLILGGLAVVLGWTAGSTLLPAMRIGVTETLDPGGIRWAAAPLVTTAAVMAFIIVAATVVPAVRSARLSAAVALRPSVECGRSAWPARLATRLGGGPVVIGGVKDIVQRPLRTALAMLSVVLAVVALIVTLGFGATIDRATGNPADVGDPWDALVVPTADTDRTALTKAIAATPGVTGWFGETGARRVIDGQVALVRAVFGNPGSARYVIHEGRAMSVSGEAIAGYGLLHRLGRRVGDTVNVEIENVSVPVRIVGRYGETEDSGEVLLFRAETLATAFPQAEPAAYFVTATPGVNRAELVARLQGTIASGATVRPLTVDTGSLNAFGLAFWLVAALVLAVALANLGSTMALGVRERARDSGVLRAIGFTPRQLRGSTAIATLLLIVGAIVVGVPAGLLLGRALLEAVGKAIGAGPELRAPPPVAVTTLLVGLMAVVSVAIGVLTCVQTSRRPVSELMRYE